ncbi:cyclic nucleotide-binding-like protein [Obelidium mucronatum]|nr:cyclic nucleotide-binding-like protein [Obelidium mucronatum]
MHVQACVIFLAGRLFEFSNHEIEPYKDATIFDQYMWSLYMSATNIFPLGYHPVNSLEQFITVVFVVCGAALYACIVGAISSVAIGFDASGRLYKQKIDELKEYMHWKAVEPVTQRKVLKYYELKYRGKYFEEAELLNRINESLRMEISIHNCKELISKVSFLRRQQGDGRDDLFSGRITSALEPCYYVPGDVVFVQGEIGHDMYFIQSGAVLVSISGKGVAILRDGAFFGEIALVANIPRTATVQAVSSCVLYRLSQDSFDKIINAFDDVKRKVNHIYTERMEKIRVDEEMRKLQVSTMLVSEDTVLEE